MAGDVTSVVVYGALNTGNGATTDFTKTDFGTPKAAIIELFYDTSDGATAASELRLSIGLTDFTNHHYISIQAEDNVAAENSKGQKDSAGLDYYLIDPAGADDGSGVASTITDGVRLTNSSIVGAAVFVKITMFGGADLAVKAGRQSFTNPGVNDTNVTTTGIDQDIIFFIVNGDAVEGSTTNDYDVSFGFATTGREAGQSIANRCVGVTNDDGNNSGDPETSIRSNRCLSLLSKSGAYKFGVELTAANATTFTTTLRDATTSSGREFYYLALALDPTGTRRKSAIGSIDSPTSAGNWSKTGLGWKPGIVGLVVSNVPAEDTLYIDSNAGSEGISTFSGSGEEACGSIYDEDAAGTINVNSCFRSRAVYLFDNDGATITYDLSFSSFDAGGWTLSQVGTPSATASKWIYWAIEEAPAGAEIITFTKEAVVVTGQAFTINAIEDITFTKAALALTGQPFISNAIEDITFTKAALALTGQPFTADENVDIVVRNLTLTGQPFTADENVEFNTRNKILTGQPFITNIAVEIVMDVGSTTLTGQPFVLDENIEFNTRNKVLTGQAFTTNIAVEIVMDVGSTTLTGKPFTVTNDVIITLSTEAFVLTGQPFISNAIEDITFTKAAFTLTGKPFTANENVDMGVRTLTLTGQPFVVNERNNVLFGRKAKNLTGKPFTVAGGTEIDFVVRSLTLTGQPFVVDVESPTSIHGSLHKRVFEKGHSQAHEKLFPVIAAD